MYEDTELLKECAENFLDVTLSGGRPLYDLDFSDSSFLYRPLHAQPYSDADQRQKLIDSIESGAWKRLVKDAAIEAIRTGRQAVEPFSSWKMIPAWYLNDHYTGFFFLDGKSFRYYLPAFILNYVREKGELNRNNVTVQAWMDVLMNPGEPGSIDEKNFIEVHSEMSELQLNSELNFLLWVVENEVEQSVSAAAFKAIEGLKKLLG